MIYLVKTLTLGLFCGCQLSQTSLSLSMTNDSPLYFQPTSNFYRFSLWYFAWHFCCCNNHLNVVKVDSCQLWRQKLAPLRHLLDLMWNLYSNCSSLYEFNCSRVTSLIAFHSLKWGVMFKKHIKKPWFPLNVRIFFENTKTANGKLYSLWSIKNDSKTHSGWHCS